MNMDELANIAEAVADAARPTAMRYFRRTLEIEAKADSSPVTIADRETETAMRRVLAERCPGHGILGEEHGRADLDSELVWVLDPIDGTKSFITGMPLFCSLVALLQDGRPIIGVIDVPAIGERYSAAHRRGGTFGGETLATSSCRHLDEAAVYLAGHDPEATDLAQRFQRLKTRGRVRRYGYDAYVYALLAAGHVDLMVETDLAPYDFLALVPVVEEAGGVITDWSGEPLGLSSAGDVLAAATPELHREVLGLLAP